MGCSFFPPSLKALALKFCFVGFALALSACDFPWDEGQAKPGAVAIPGEGTPHAPPPAENQPAANCVWNFSGPRNFPCNWGSVCAGSVSCPPAGPFFQVAVCQKQHCSNASACLMDQSFEAQFCSQQLSGQINLAFPKTTPQAHPSSHPRDGR